MILLGYPIDVGAVTVSVIAGAWIVGHLYIAMHIRSWRTRRIGHPPTREDHR